MNTKVLLLFPISSQLPLDVIHDLSTTLKYGGLALRKTDMFNTFPRQRIVHSVLLLSLDPIIDHMLQLTFKIHEEFL